MVVRVLPYWPSPVPPELGDASRPAPYLLVAATGAVWTDMAFVPVPPSVSTVSETWSICPRPSASPLTATLLATGWRAADEDEAAVLLAAERARPGAVRYVLDHRRASGRPAGHAALLDDLAALAGGVDPVPLRDRVLVVLLEASRAMTALALGEALPDVPAAMLRAELRAAVKDGAVRGSRGRLLSLSEPPQAELSGLDVFPVVPPPPVEEVLCWRRFAGVGLGKCPAGATF